MPGPYFFNNLESNGKLGHFFLSIQGYKDKKSLS